MAGKTVYKGAVIRVEEYITPKTGSRFARVIAQDAVGILPLFRNGKILLERQYRYTMNKYLYEIPAGHIDDKEKPKTAAKRELEEETGYLARKLTRMFGFYAAPGSNTQFMHLYLAEELKKTEIDRGRDEIIELVIVSLSRAAQMIRKNEIRDAKTMASILYYLKFVKK